MNYGNIKSHFNELLNRSDITTSLTTRFIDQGIARVQRQLRTPANEKLKTHNISTTTASISLPSDFIEIISVYYDQHELNRVPMSKFRQLNKNNHIGSPTSFTRQQEKLLLHPQPATGSLVLYYYGEFDAMSQDSDENTLASIGSDLIIYAALTYAADFYLDDRGQNFEAKYQAFLKEIQEQANDQELNGGINAVQPNFTYED